MLSPGLRAGRAAVGDLGLVDAHDGVDGDAIVDVGVDARVQTPVPVPVTAWADAKPLRRSAATRSSEVMQWEGCHGPWTEIMLAGIGDHLLMRYPVFLL